MLLKPWYKQIITRILKQQMDVSFSPFQPPRYPGISLGELGVLPAIIPV